MYGVSQWTGLVSDKVLQVLLLVVPTEYDPMRADNVGGDSRPQQTTAHKHLESQGRVQGERWEGRSVFQQECASANTESLGLPL